MKKYKLIKEYPNSDRIGTIVGEGLSRFFYEKHPEFWEEIIEKDYEILSSNDLYKIYSIKRLSDGEIFTIGDDVHNPICVTQKFKIESFYMDSSKTHLLVGKGHVGINKIQHFKLPLFTTEDGVEIFEGDITYSINKDDLQVHKFKCLKEGKLQYSHYLDFSTKEAANDYILKNKPCLSYKEVYATMGEYNNITYSDLHKLAIKLEELVKSKI